jgi:hypothetical protein
MIRTTANAPHAASGALAAILVCGLSLLPATAPAEEVGTIAALEPTVEIERGGERLAALLGAPIQLGDTLHTGPSGRLRVVFRDESVVNLAPDTKLLVDEQVYRSEEGAFASVLGLVRGKVRAMVSEHYTNPGASFQVETRTGVAGVRGTDFIALYDEGKEVTEVVGVSGRIAVSSPVALEGSSVVVTEREMTSVALGKLPTAPLRVDDLLFRQYLEDFEFIGAGRPESLALASPILTGNEVPEDDLPEVPGPAGPTIGSPVPGEPIYGVPDVSTLLDQPPFAVNAEPGLGIRF